MPRAAKKRSWPVAVLLAALVAGAVPAAEASIPPPESWPSLLEEPAASVLEPPSLADLAAELATPAMSPEPATAASAGEPFRLFEDLELGLTWRSEPRFRLYPRPKTRVRAITLPEPLHIELELPLTDSRFRLYRDPPAGIAVGGTFLTADPLGYVDGPSMYAFALNNPVSFSDPFGDRVRFVRVDNEDNIRELTEDERKFITSGLEEFIGAEFTINEEGELEMGEISAESSPTGMLFMRAVIEDLGKDHIVYVFDRGWPDLAFGIQRLGCVVQPIALDIGDVGDLKFRGQATPATGGVGAFLVHELVHTALGFPDPPHDRNALEPGPTVDFVNLIRSERGLPLRNPYAEEPDGSFQDFTYVDQNGKKVGRVTANTSRLLGQGARYRNWCREENRRAKAEGRISKCRGGHSLFYEEHPP